MLIQDQFGIIHNLEASQISQTSFLVGTFFASSYNKIALVIFLAKNEQVQRINLPLL